jgi:hypothetical protein
MFLYSNHQVYIRLYQEKLCPLLLLLYPLIIIKIIIQKCRRHGKDKEIVRNIELGRELG